MHGKAAEAVAALLIAGEKVYVLPQNIAEFWNVCTRPANQNGFGWTVKKTVKEVAQIEIVLELKRDKPDIYGEWRKLVEMHSVKGVQVHDARIVAAMIVHRIDKILTFNATDFRRYTKITALTPSAVLAQYRSA